MSLRTRRVAFNVASALKALIHVHRTLFLYTIYLYLYLYYY
jgi:hypothetical protein